MIDYNKTKIERALNDLYKEGLKGYKPEYRDGLNRFEAIVVYTEWNTEKEGYDTARYRVEVVLTKIED